MAYQEELNRQPELSQIKRLISRTRRLLRSSWIATGTGLTIGLAMATLVATTMADLVVALPIFLRVLAFLIVVVPTLLALVAGVVRPAMRKLSTNLIARRIEREIPSIQSRLITAIDLSRRGSHRHSPVFFQRLITETTDRVACFQPKSVVDRTSLRRSGVFAASATLAFLLALLCFSGRLPTALARVLSPLADIPPATGVVFRAEPGDAKVLKGEDLNIAAIIEKGEPAQMELEFRPTNGKWLRFPMENAGPGRTQFTMEQLANSIEYRLIGGGTWTRKHRIEVIERPTITDIFTAVHNPEYMKLPEPLIGPHQISDAAGPVGSDIEVFVDVAGDVVTGEIQLLSPVTKMKPIEDRKERVWFESTLPEGARAEGNWQWDHTLKFRVAHTEPPAAGPHGHLFHSTKTGFEIQPGDHLFTYVFIVPGQVPEEIMVQWHDGTNWEHRAFWGADIIQAGAVNSPSRFRAGELPAAGEWVLLDIPASAVDLEGKRIHGMSFQLFGGQAKFNRAGTIDPAELPERSYIVEWRYPMSRAEDSADESPAAPHVSNASTPQRLNALTSRWSGHIPLTRDTLYRIELKNELGYANKEMKEGKLTAIPDGPPQVILERPGSDLVISEPQKIPLVVRAYDDFGLSDVALSIQKGDSGGFVGSPIKVYEDPVRNDSVVAGLDLKPHLQKPGDFVRYRVQARDRKGQIAQTQEFVVKLADDANAADKQLASLEKQYDSFQQKLIQLIAQQSKITESVDKMAGKERPTEPGNQTKDSADSKPSENRTAPTDTRKDAAATNSANKSARSPDPATAADIEKKLAELRQELAKLAAQQEANAQLGQQVQGELTQAANQAAASKLMPEQLAAQIRAAEQMFQNQALQPMRDLLQAMRQAADPKQPNPDVNNLADSSQHIQEQLEAMKSRLEALARAQQNLKDDPAEALAQLRQDLMAQNAALAANELAEMRDSLDRLLGQLKLLEGREADLARQTKDAMPVVLPEIAKEQTKIETDAEILLAQAERIMESDDPRQAKRRRRSPEFPDAPYTPEGEEMLVTPTEGDTPDPSASEMKGAKKASNKKAEANEEDEDEQMFVPPTGVRQKIDPRFAKKARPVTKKDNPIVQAEAKQPQNDVRNQLSRRQQQTAQQLNDAHQQLQPRREQLADLMQQLRDALGLQSDEAAHELAQLMQSMSMQQAMQLAQAMRRSQAAQQPATPPQPGQPSPQPPQVAQSLAQALSSQSNTGMRVGSIAESELNDLDLAAQTLILRMQPRLREELLRGMREEGPEAYRKFIQDYFNRLTKVKSPQ